MKKRGFWLVLFAIVILSMLGYKAVFQGTDRTPEHIRIHEPGSPGEQQPLAITQDRIYQGDLLLINLDHPVRSAGVKSDVVHPSRHEELLGGYSLPDTRIRVSESVGRAFVEMVQAAQQDGVVHFMLNSGYRDVEEQQRLYEEMGPESALPGGYSEHNAGLALDIASSQMLMKHAPEGKWLQKHAWKYGFILRYPAGKEAITGTKYEPWHYRYVGLPHSAIMHDMQFTLEEYLAYLQKNRHFAVEVEGRSYEIAYHAVSEDTTIDVPVNRPYVISGDNVGGIVLTVYSE